MEIVFQNIKEMIEDYDYITIFRHARADYDALGSQLGLKKIIEENYPNKHVYAYGKNDIYNPDFIDLMDDVEEEKIINNLAIICDSATASRIDGQIALQAKEIASIDHHFDFEDFADITCIDSESTSTSQLIVELALYCKWKIPKDAANLLYAGILTDTVQLSIDRVNARAFKAILALSENGLDVVKVNRCCFDKTIKEYEFYHSLANQVSFEKDLAYLYIDLETQRKMSISSIKAKDQIDLMKNIIGVERWLLFVENKEGDYSCSLRSHYKPVNHIANKFGGGGHVLASGIPHLTYEDTKIVIQLLLEEE